MGPGSVAYTITELLDHLPEDVDRTLWCLGTALDADRPYQRAALPPLLYKFMCKLGVPAHLQGRAAMRAVLQSIESGDLVYVWPPYDRRLIRNAKKRGAIVIAERINCMGNMVREALTSAYARRGKLLPAGWCAPREFEKERNQMLACDFATAPNQLVAQSLRYAGFPQSRIIETSYGFSPDRLAGAVNTRRPERKPVFAFVGLGIVRKGLDVLLEAWELAGIDGELLIAGTIEDEIKTSYARVLARDDVAALGHVSDVGQVYAAADVFVFPTHEEGGPQVSYEAAACGLASIVSPMGTGRVLRDGQECLLIDPLDVESVVKALKHLASDPDLRKRLAKNAADRSLEFTWEKVSHRLYGRFRQIADDQPRLAKGRGDR